MELEIFKKLDANTYDQTAVIDSFRSLVVNRRFFTSNDFELKLELSMDNLTNLKKGNAVRIDGVFYYINYSGVEDLKTGVLLVKGVSFFGLLNQRIIWENYTKQARPESIARDLLLRHVITPTDTNRKITQISVANDTALTPTSVLYQNSYGMIREAIESLAETYEFGFKEEYVDPFIPHSKITFMKGKDLSDSVEFTTDAENVLNESYESSDFDERNVALVAGEGEGTARTLVTLGSGKGLDRKELYVDARDLQSEKEDETKMTTAEYKQVLTERGKSKLSEQQAILILDGDINVQNQLYEYKVDYDLGDTVRRSSPTFNLAYSAQITEIQEIYENGLQIVPTFGKRSPTLIDIIKRK